MTHIDLLRSLSEVTREATKDLLLPVAKQKGDATDPECRAPEVYMTRLPDSGAAKKKAPYVIHQLITSSDRQPNGEYTQSTATVRSIFCVYHGDEQEGGLALLNVMERLRIALLRQRVIGEQFQLDMEQGAECLVYPDDTAPYYAGEMVTTWQLPPVEREVTRWL